MKCSNFWIAAVLAAAAIVLAGCNNDETENESLKLSDVAIEVTAGIFTDLPQTRVIGTAWETGDAIGIFQLLDKTVKDANRAYVNVGTAAFMPKTPGEAIYFPVETAVKSDFIAYFPYKVGQTGLDYVVNVAWQADQEAIDLLTADKQTGRDKNNPILAFNFKHRLSKLALTLAAGYGLTDFELKGINVTMTEQLTAATCDLNTGMLIASGKTHDIILKTTSNGLQSEAIILPAEATPGRQLVFTLKNGDVYRWDIPADKAFHAGEKNIYLITLNRTSIAVTATITDWTYGNGSGEAGNAE